MDCSPFGQHNTKQLHLDDGPPEVPEEKKCSRCGEVKKISKYSFRTRRGVPYSYCKACNSRDVLERQREFKRRCVQHKGGSCQICGYERCLAALTFHHIDPEQKEFAISSKNSYSSLTPEIRQELDKCVLLCHNCHCEEHARIKGWLDDEPVFS